MSVIPKSRLPMRIIALPLTGAVRGPRHTEDPSPLVYYHFQMRLKEQKTRVGWVDWATGKAASVWAQQFGKAPGNSWKFKLFTYGERLADRIDFEELALKGVDPSLGPKISHRSKPSEPEDEKKTIPLVHPPIVGTSPLAHLEAILTRRGPRHRKGFYTWMLLTPLTAPFMLIPVIPNFPFFFCVWRSWSHYRAYKASDYLLLLLQRGTIVPRSDANLDSIYAKHALSDTLQEAASDSGTGKDEGMKAEKRVLLKPDAVPQILELYGLPESAAPNMYRAIEQASSRLRKGIYT